MIPYSNCQCRVNRIAHYEKEMSCRIIGR